MKIKPFILMFFYCAIIVISINAEIETTKNEKQSGGRKEVDVGLRHGGEHIGGLNLVEYRGANATKELKVINVGMNLIEWRKKGKGVKNNGTENEAKKERPPKVKGRQNRELQDRRGWWNFWKRKHPYNITHVPNKEEGNAANKPKNKGKTNRKRRGRHNRESPQSSRRWWQWQPRRWEDEPRRWWEF